VSYGFCTVHVNLPQYNMASQHSRIDPTVFSSLKTSGLTTVG